jgi:hypothetical protein
VLVIAVMPVLEDEVCLWRITDVTAITRFRVPLGL